MRLGRHMQQRAHDALIRFKRVFVVSRSNVMPRIRFTGRVLPAAFHISIDNLPSVAWRDEELVQLGIGEPTCHTKIQNSIVTADCEVNQFEKEKHLMPLYMRALDLVRVPVNLMSVGTGTGLSVILDQLIEPNGNATALAPEQPTLAALVPSISATTAGYDAVLRLVIPEYPILHVLHDLAEAITQTHVAPTNCGRAIDGLRHAIAPSVSRDEQWKSLRDNLRVEKAYLRIITDLSTGPRHADPTHIPGPVVKDVVERTWIVMNRYFEFLKRGKQPLPETEFPILS